ncbi:hypothetical protein RhiXN_08421 [Rhizoctonia solani]|uniref:Protein CPL1-like domain-containing protein n=1 Tax=Rhizoctonia solani TaxID=456999 RepID=A0A8H8P2U0_9AGAM|nr:uncharacterized protein RhiXN_08421 [Rhizoctonia solani]QRW23385.1 hypothetical protein RhiXN_08421 [Rhizoctonia solani]
MDILCFRSIPHIRGRFLDHPSGAVPASLASTQSAELVGVADRGITALAMGIGMLAQQVHTMTRQPVNERMSARPYNVDSGLAVGTPTELARLAKLCVEKATTPRVDRPLVLFALPACIVTLKQHVIPNPVILVRMLTLLELARGVRIALLVLSITVMGTLRVAIVVLDGLVKETTRIPTASDAQTSGKFSLFGHWTVASSGRLRLARNHEPNPQEVAVSATSGSTPSGAMTRSTTSTCPYGTTRCEVKFGRGGFECVDILNSLETCGGCDNDCSSLEGTNEVQCIKGQCVVKSCAGGHELAIRGDGFARGGLDVGAHCVAKKRNHIRHATML